MDGIIMYGCRENNLKNVDVKIPYSQITSFIGVSGSGKSTLVFDTLYAEGKRRYIESLGVNESYFLSKIKKPEADYFMGIPPAIALSQNRVIRSPRSTVGTISQAVYYLQLLFSTCGEQITKEKIELTPSMFNLNSPNGMCFECNGVGEILEFDELLIWPDQNLSISQGGLKLGGAKKGTNKYHFLDSFLKQYGFDVDTPIRDYTNELKVALLFGQKKTKKYKVEFPGIITDSEKVYRTTKSIDVRENLEKFMTKSVCPKCGGTGYRPEVLLVLINGKNINDYMLMSIEELVDFLENYSFDDYRERVFLQIKSNFLSCLNQCINLGVGYLSLSRNATTLSGGEMQRLRLVAQMSSQISGVVYVLDEPSSGLHASDVDKLIEAIKNLNNIGNKNTVVLVEHSAMIINESDYIVEVGPGAGENGGEIIAQGTVEEIKSNEKSISGKYLAYKDTAGMPNKKIGFEMRDFIKIIGANANNLLNLDVKIPLNCMVCVTGVSGSGKTSLIFDSLYQSFYYNRNINLREIEGREKIDRIILCDQSPVGKSSRSCPVSYLDIYSNIRKIFACTETAKAKKYDEKFFSFNLKEGRCDKCSGDGVLKINMGFLPEMSVECDRCEGKRFKQEILEIKYKDKNISDVLDMSIDEASIFFENQKQIINKLNAMKKVGLGYLKLGQSTSSLSGGESQRLKLANEISKSGTKNTLILFDEPSKGLHFEDVKCLLKVMQELVCFGNSLLLVEHNLDVISSCDYVIDIGPYAGEKGGKVVGIGTPYEISAMETLTGKALRKYYDLIQ